MKSRVKGHERLNLIRSSVQEWAELADFVVVEGPSYGSHGPGHHELAGLWWLVRHQLWEMDKPVAIVAPTARAKYACGKGNAGKDDVLAAVIRRYGIGLDIDIAGNDIADALVLAAMGARWLDFPVEERLPEVNAAAMVKVNWPEA